MPPSLERIRDLAVYRHRGEGTQVVLIHGAMDRGAGMLRVARRLRGAPIVRYDRRGYGRSIDTGPSTGFDQQVDDLRAVIDGRPSLLLGHSYGGVVAMALATAAAREVVGVVTYEAPRAWESWWPPPEDISDAEEAADAAERFLRRMVGDEVWESLPERTRAQRRAEGAVMVAEMQHQRTQRYSPADIAVPLVVGVGERSGPLAQRAARLTAGEAQFGELHVIAGAGHGAHSTHAAELADLVDAARPR